MERLKVLIVDDEVLIAEDLKDILKSFGIKNVSLAHDKASALLSLTVFEPDLVLLDIRMENDFDGLEIGEYINNNIQIPFIYITANSDVNTIQQIVNTKPAGYITKPFKKAELLININLAIEKQQNKTRHLIIKDGANNTLIPMNDISMIEGDGNYIVICCEEKKHLSRQSLDSITRDLDNAHFFKVHRSYIINLNKVTSFTKKTVFINDISIPISRSVLSDFELVMKTRIY
jgi:two-component system, LytTR family, response regulator LytT